MEKQHHILLLGNSVFMDSIAESLLIRESTNVTRISSKTQEVRETVKSLKPDLIVYEINWQTTNPIFGILNEQPNTLHLAIDLYTKQFTLLHCQRKPTGSMQELLELISQEVSSKKNSKEVH